MTTPPVEAAAHWMVRLGAEDCTEADRTAFADWCAADPEHARIAAMMGGIWSQARQVMPPARLASRRGMMAGGVGAVLALASLAPSTADARIVRTATGEMRRVPFADGEILLDTQSAVMLAQGGAALTLLGGRFGLSCNDGALRIATGIAGLQTQGGRFDIRLEAHGLAVAVLAGSMMVNTTTVLHPGDRLMIRADGSCVRDRPNLGDLLAWHSGRIVFRDTPLREAVADMNRYSMTRLMTDARSGSLQISGYYHVGNPQAFAHAVAQLLPVRVVANGHDLRIVKL